MATRRRWWWVIALVSVVVVAVGAVAVVRYVVFRDTTTTLSPEDALARYRASTSAPATTPTATTAATTAAPESTTTATATTAAPLTLPDAGVYRYATTGDEHIDALGGTTHTYPPVTTMTITPDGCGVLLRWDALEERWAARQLCLGAGGIVSGAYSDFHRFFGQDDRSDWACQPPYVLVPDDALPGASWKGHCVDGDDQEDTTITLVGIEDVSIGGAAARALHVHRVEADTASDSTASTTTDQWFDTRNGLVLREQATSTSTTASPVGDVHYQEQYTLDLLALEPQR